MAKKRRALAHNCGPADRCIRRLHEVISTPFYNLTHLAIPADRPRRSAYPRNLVRCPLSAQPANTVNFVGRLMFVVHRVPTDSYFRTKTYETFDLC